MDQGTFCLIAAHALNNRRQTEEKKCRGEVVRQWTYMCSMSALRDPALAAVGQLDFRPVLSAVSPTRTLVPEWSEKSCVELSVGLE
jgi:hypothetical protein